MSAFFPAELRSFAASRVYICVRWWRGQYDDDQERASGRSVYTDAPPMSHSEVALLVVLIAVQAIMWLWVVAVLLRL